ncbi:hypothetical protein N7470_004144 [Penicillium chermesinum]|nr:hypothetical protein N7470_004144 [Penicillium chermesinum]
MTIGLLIGFFLSNLDVTIVSSSLTHGQLEWIREEELDCDGIPGHLYRDQWPYGPNIVFRALQGIGGAGAYALTILCVYEISPKTKLPTYSALTAFCLALANLSGPIIGGALSNRYTDVRMVLLSAPSQSSWWSSRCQHTLALINTPSFRTRASYRSFANLDITGSFLIMAGTFLTIAVLNETNLAFHWSSGAAIALLVLAGASWIAFFAWEWYNSGHSWNRPDIPEYVGCSIVPGWAYPLLHSLLVLLFNVVLVYVPQQAQFLNQSPLDAGIYLMAYSGVAAVAAAFINFASSKGRGFVYSLLAGCFHASDIGYEVVAGAGMGLIMGVLVLSPPYIVEDRDLTIATGTVVQLRFLGGAIGLAIASNILNGHLRDHLDGILSSHDLHLFLENVQELKLVTPHLQETVKGIVSSSYTTQLRVMIGFAGAQLFAALLLIRPGRQLAAVRKP